MFHCEKIKNRMFHFTGISFCGPFSDSFPEEAVRLQDELWQRKEEISETDRNDVLFSPHFESESLSVYWACCEVSAHQRVPPGMVGHYRPMSTVKKRVQTIRLQKNTRMDFTTEDGVEQGGL
ncbi:hypothetical protein JSY36_19875 [Bacillus sp. H-16]|uniref:hypothetical protein n=1 Tax=Alteribacter salitolerans TaxID=2912333 RepID=UPI0019628A6F|nr:hypothetical protein [Alteribacter salitolerans]MBM7097983.1 hypothetical protein [Alteribacter salitolerans]